MARGATATGPAGVVMVQASYNSKEAAKLLNSTQVKTLLTACATKTRDYANGHRSPDDMANRPYEMRVFDGTKRAHAQVFTATPHGRAGEVKDHALIWGLMSV